MSNNNHLYKMTVVRDVIQGINTPTVYQIVEQIMSKNSNRLMKKEDIDREVALKMGYHVDASISNAVSGVLKSMEKQGKVSHPKHGYWQSCLLCSDSD
ncbi:hypothetical protein CI793_00205 [Anoxybacillus ayderensis]|uniref:Uncharacterized protein n=1 Tax=Anoxybacillus flavithermus (strain DSM 21510 / WK1) TaxID=491915 RepID=B7GM80_ANOFW|nr:MULTISPECIES: hypothetical protein [Anoxybacillus]ACJ34982.1 Predicted protein [Anoxybacillus flavithermus WK1]NNU96411.1 hypothetical protein [Anoxybacillus sp. EFIL]THD17726.1 hypothetical protein CI793_00205 [Anoxybacillus ayderensis]